MADTSTTAMFACISTFRSNVSSYEGTMLHELILTPMTSIVTVITLIISSFVYAKYRCVWKTMIVITVILLAGAFIYWMSVKVLENWTLAVTVGSVVVVTGWRYARNIGTFIGVITKWKTGITQLRRLLSWLGVCKGDGSKGTLPKIAVSREEKTLRFQYPDSRLNLAQADNEYEETEIETNVEPTLNVEESIIKNVQELVRTRLNAAEWEKNVQLSAKLAYLFQLNHALLSHISFKSVHFFVLVKIGPGHDAFLQACTDGTLLRGLEKLLVTPELEQTAGCKLKVKMEVKKASTEKNICKPTDSRQNMAGNQPRASAMNMMHIDGRTVTMEQIYQLTRELSKDEIVTLSVKLEVRSERTAALEDKSKTYQDVLPQMFVYLIEACGLREKLLETLKNNDLEQRDSNTKILTTRCEQQVTEMQLLNIADNIPPDSYQSFCHNLGFEAKSATNILRKHLGNQRTALMEILIAWRNRTGGPRTDLARYLFKAYADDFAEILSL